MVSMAAEDRPVRAETSRRGVRVPVWLLAVLVGLAILGVWSAASFVMGAVFWLVRLALLVVLVVGVFGVVKFLRGPTREP